MSGMKNGFQKAVGLTFILALILVFTGCGTKRHEYLWVEYPITPERVEASAQLQEGSSLKLIAGNSEKKEFMMGNVGPHHYYGNLQMLADAIVEQLGDELHNRKIKVQTIQDNTKSLTITVKNSSFERGMWKIAVNMEFDVTFGDKTLKSYKVRNSSPTTVNRTYDGVVAIAVIQLLNDPEIINYINK